METQASLSGKVALVTGGSRGIGRAAATALLDEGASVAIAARTAEEVARTAEELSGHGPVFARAADVSDESEVQALVQAVVDWAGHLDILVCSHGISVGHASFQDIPLAKFEEAISVNLVGVFLCAKECSKRMIAAGSGGRIIAISSVNGLRAVAGSAAYNTSKCGLTGLVQTFALDLSHLGITANIIAPGWVRTVMTEGELSSLEGYKLNPVNRAGEPDEISRAVTWLADPRSSYVTGSIITIDGGATATLMPPIPI